MNRLGPGDLARLSLGASCSAGEPLKALLQRQPCRPFDLHLADGEIIPVRHPGVARASRGGRTVVVEAVDEVFSMIDSLMITRRHGPATEGAAEAGSEPSNGASGSA